MWWNVRGFYQGYLVFLEKTIAWTKNNGKKNMNR